MEWSGGGPKALILGAVVLIGLAFSGYVIDSRTPFDGPQETSDFLFEWFPDDPDFEYLVRIDTQGETHCYASHKINGQLTHESGIGSYKFAGHDAGSSSLSTARADDSVHAGPVNSAHVSGPTWGEFFSYSTSWSTSTLGGWQYTVQAAFSTTEPREPLRVECDGPDVWLRFYRADSLEPIMSSSSTGGIGLEAWTLPALPSAVGLNVADRYTITTEGDFVFFRVSDTTLPGESSIEGELRIQTPMGVEVAPLEPHEGHENVDFTRIWSGPGTYEIEFDRFAENHSPLQGLLAGFVLEQEFGGFEESN